MTSSRILLTGAAGQLGRVLREALVSECDMLRLSDIRPLGAPGSKEEIVTCDLADADAVHAMCEGIDAIVHFGGIATEADWAGLLQANILGLINIYEGARRAGVDRVIFASSNHTIGLYPNERKLSHLTTPRPDSRYGLTKAFGEDIGALYAYKHGIRSLSLRIGSCCPKPENRRALSTWLSYNDLIRLVRAGLTADYIYEIAYGVSNNSRSWWDNSAAARLGYEPQDNAEDYAAQVEHVLLDHELAQAHQGGSYVSTEFSGKKDWLSQV
jgi:uronate dehydrogenase